MSLCLDPRGARQDTPFTHSTTLHQQPQWDGYKPSPFSSLPTPSTAVMVKPTQGAGGWFPPPHASSCCVDNEKPGRNQPKAAKCEGVFASLLNKTPLITSKVFNERLEGVLSIKRGLRVIFIAHSSLLCSGSSDLLLPEKPKGDAGLRLSPCRVPVGRKPDTV